MKHHITYGNVKQYTFLYGEENLLNRFISFHKLKNKYDFVVVSYASDFGTLEFGLEEQKALYLYEKFYHTFYCKTLQYKSRLFIKLYNSLFNKLTP